VKIATLEIVYDPAMNEACTFVLAGGQSSRMARDKAFLSLEGATLLERALAVAREVTGDVRIVGSTEKFGAFAETVEDQFVGCGPLGGIHAALSASAQEYNLVLAVDMPFVEGKFLAYLLEQARVSNAFVTVPRAEGRLQPLCAVYRREFAPLAETSLRAGRNRIDPLFSGVALRVVDEREMAEHGFSPEIFRNLNTPEEFERAVLIKKK
jgi:molybdopterin-guanine dinucleotide biosynthesis protein A